MSTSVVKKLGHLFLFTAVFCMLGGPWAMLQTIAWGRMLVDYSKDSGLRDGVAMTFDGEHPCEMCCAIKEQRTETETPSKAVNTSPLRVRLLAVTPVAHLPCHPDFHIEEWPDTLLTASSLSPRKPPVPPPRIVAS